MVSSFLGKDGGHCIYSRFCVPDLEKEDEPGDDKTPADIVFAGGIAGSGWMDNGGERPDRRCNLCEPGKTCRAFCAGIGIDMLCILVCVTAISSAKRNCA